MEIAYYFESDTDLSDLKDWELTAIKYLKSAVVVVAKIYSKQKNQKYLGSNFYPSDLTQSEFDKASILNLDLKNPCTLVKRIGQELVAIPYSTEYKSEITEININLEQAAKLYEQNNDLEYADYLRAIITDLQRNNFDNSFEKYLKLNNSTTVDITLGAYETYQDKLFGIKRAFQANLRIKESKDFTKISEYVKVINAIQPSVSGGIKNTELSNLTVRVDNVVALGGWHAELLPVGSNYPVDPKLYVHGAKVLIYLNNLYKRYDNLILVAKEVFEPNSIKYIDEKKFLPNVAKFITFHEVAEVISKIRYNFYKGKIKHLSDVVRELNSDLTGIKAASIHVLNGILSASDYKDIVIAAICDGLRSNYLAKDKSAGIKVYADGWMFAIGYMLNEGGLSVTKNNKFEIDFNMLYSSIANLTTIFNDLMIDGDFEKADKLFSTYSAKEVLPIFDDRLKKYFG